MVINENNSVINSFVKGMNSDSSFDQVSNELYIFGKNIRITKNLFLGGTNDYSSVHEGIVTPVPEGYTIGLEDAIIGRIIAVDSVDNLGIIISSTGHDMYIYKLYIDEINNTCTFFKEIISFVNVWKDKVAPAKISTVLYKELDNVIKLYIATGEHPIISLRVDDESVGGIENPDVNKYQNAVLDDLINNRIIPKNRILITDTISGRLTTSLVQYTYRCYNKYGNTTLLAPLTNKIQIIDPNRSKETGNAEDTETAIGLSLSIDISEYKTYDRIQVYRLQYVIPGLDAEVSLIYDGSIKDTSSNIFVLNDVGIDPLQKLSMEEFSTMSGLILVPLTIEQNQEYMFCANVKDDTIIRSAEIGSSTYSLVKADVVLSDKLEGDVPDAGSHSYNDGEYNNIIDTSDNRVVTTVSEYINDRGVNANLVKATYNNIYTSSLLRSLRRGETYKYAIVFYDKYGRRTDVKNICDVHVKEYEDERPFDIENGSLIAHPLGVDILIPSIDLSESDIELEDIIGCLIVRRTSSDIYQRNLLQVALARPVSQGLLDYVVENLDNVTDEDTKKSPFYPSGFLSVNGLYIFPGYYSPSDDYSPENTTQSLWHGHYLATSAKTRNHKLYQIFSSEIDYRRDDVLSRINTSDTNIKEVLYIPAVFAKYENSIKKEIYDGTFPVNADYNKAVIESSTVSGHDPGIETYRSTSILAENGNLWFLLDRQYMDTTKGITFSLGPIDIATGRLLYDIHSDVVDVQYGPTVQIGSDISSDANVVNFINDLTFVGYPLYLEVAMNPDITDLTITTQLKDPSDEQLEGFLLVRRDRVMKMNSDMKTNLHYIFNFFQPFGVFKSGFGNNNVNLIKDVKIPNWDSGFTEIQRSDAQDIQTAIKRYKSFSTNIDSFAYNNWVSFGKYDLRAGIEDQNNMDGWGYVYTNCELLGKREAWDSWVETRRHTARCGFIGAGPSCFLLTTQNDAGEFPLATNRFYTSICNIQHNPKLTDVLSDDFTQYFGFGNYFTLQYDSQQEKLLHNGKDSLTVFDGDIYITPHEFTTMYKAYEFNSYDTLQSTQIVNYIPLESKVNTYFDYGMNYMNTNSENLIYEPGHIDGVTAQERPAHLYNMIYSDNDASNDVFTLISTDKNETNQFKQRAYYSDLKTNGEFVDNFLIFKPAQFIDVNSRYGLITNLLTDKNQLYYWQDCACGKFSVNERSLVNDLNSNTIMLGQAGILSRYDYLSTRYGMRLYDFCAKATEGGVFWVDINNKAIAALSENRAINYGEQVGVLNIINNNITSDVPNVDYDLQNDEVLCKCFGTNLLIFNIKYNIATSIYTRNYEEMLYIKNHIYGLKPSNKVGTPIHFYITKYNYLDYNENNHSFLSPLQLSFVVNPMASITKVFDSLQMIPIKRDACTATDHTEILDNATMQFETDIVRKTYGLSMEPYTDREGNIIYNVPRYTTGNGYGNRIRGKWLRVDINNTNPTEFTTLSHVITKFRQSYS